MDFDDWEEVEPPQEPEYEDEPEFEGEEFDRFRRRVQDSEDLEVEAEVFDVATLKAVYRLVNTGAIDAIGGAVSTGKEANVFEALRDGEDVALKIYRVETSSFDDMRYYFEGDPRFEGIGGSKLDVVRAWVTKEMSNLERAADAGVRVPEPVAAERNLLAMEFVGEAGDRAPQIREVEMENPDTAFEVAATYLERLYDAGLVHGDLSEYNVLVDEGDLVVIDMGQAVTVHHPNSDDLLRQDCRNVARYFSNEGVDVDAEELYDRVTA